ncbi:MAG: DUF362 domain-containing protein [Candidatus Thorarchaeota archaeon]
MSGGIIELGAASFAASCTRNEFAEIVSRLDLKSPVIIKPNWSTCNVFTESELLDWTLSEIDEEAVIVESYALYRNKLLHGHEGPIDAEYEEKIGIRKRSDFRKNEEWFLRHSGIAEILDKHSVEYINLTEEMWANRTCDADMIKDVVESRFDGVSDDILYSLVPSKLYDMRGGTLLNLAKLKRSLGPIGISLTFKNMFGMIPSPFRGRYHGEDDCMLAKNIVDINKIYASMFSLAGVVESVFTATITDEQYSVNVNRDIGAVWSSKNTLELDAIVAVQMGVSPHDVNHLKLASEQFGIWDSRLEELAIKYPIRLSNRD